MASAATGYSVPGLGTIEVNAKDGRVELRRSVAGTLIERVIVTFLPERDPTVELLLAGARDGGPTSQTIYMDPDTGNDANDGGGDEANPRPVKTWARVSALCGQEICGRVITVRRCARP
jgi:hypothetical protein